MNDLPYQLSDTIGQLLQRFFEEHNKTRHFLFERPAYCYPIIIPPWIAVQMLAQGVWEVYKDGIVVSHNVRLQHRL